jgi:hypothetical protein
MGHMIERLIGWFFVLVIVVLVWHVLQNGAYYGDALGGGVNGVIALVQAFFNRISI